MRNITKEFPGVKALEAVRLQVRKGEIHALVGENGAGKSTLMKVLSGVHPHGTYTGDIYFDGNVCEFNDVNDSEGRGIVIIHQELALVPELSIAENIFLGNEQARYQVIHWNETIQKTLELLGKVGLSDSPETRVGQIGVGKQQLVEIAKALSKEVKLLILDEPTAALNEEDSENLLNLILEFKKQGITSILISHKLNEVSQVADAITILRDGRTIETLDVQKEEITEARIIKGMVGRELTDRFPEKATSPGNIIFEVKDWSFDHPLQRDGKMIEKVNLHIRRGEIVGIAGLMGAGRTELAMSLFGKAYGKNISGRMWIDGKEVALNNVSQAIEHGLAYVTEDRKNFGLNMIDDVKRNMTLASLDKISRYSVIDKNREILDADDYRKKLNIKTPGIDQKTVLLSGGNQQKVVLSKWIYSEPDVLMLDEPTRGIDVGAKYEIYTIMNQLASEGKGILMISSELPEILGMCDRIYVMSEGVITGELQRDEADQESVMKYMTERRR